ncbi:MULTISPECIES: dihydropteroate synthase [unclassified Veillonella]|jgi:dihydropteroate synthase|uniref:dihydropteroate synthase n=1 Tax=unclassified Veillonella TaxID=2630086 RepID=UPI0007831BD5|nr:MULTISPECIES: dihydropteroate synthase [unclassified Veillonella]KXB88778.1 dihydropteroate synthase [Veillonella sp. DNF00869]
MFKYRKYNWQDGKQLELKDRTLIMGILNGTPDSFSDGGRYNTSDTAVAHAKLMIEQGADILDVGVESTRPGHTQISVAEELERMKEVLLPVLECSTVPVSVDTYRAETADFALSQGAHILNDIWGLKYDKDMAAVAAKYDVPVIIMHNQNSTDYDDIIDDMKAFFFSSVDLALKEGVKPQNIWLDPGIGFGKDYAQNVEVIQRLGEITVYEYPVLLAPSRKRFIGTILNDIPVDQRDEGTVATCITGMIQGVDMVRVHNVEMHKRAITVADVLLRGE